MKKLYFVMIVVLLAVAMAGCGSSVPEVCESDPMGCAVIEKGDTVKLGMAGPMLGDYAMFGKDISQGPALERGDVTTEDLDRHVVLLTR